MFVFCEVIFIKRFILHCDLDSFYASVECLYNPSIRKYPVAVGGNPNSRHGIILAKNQIAKKFGIKTGEPLWQAKQKCPDLIFVPPNFEKYIKFSRLAKEIYNQYSDQIESYGIDECWVDISGSVSLFGSPEYIAEEIKNKIYKELGITVSIGLSYNKIFAKLGSDMNKPNGISYIYKEDFKETIWHLPASDLLYVGPATSKKLNKMSVRTIGDLAMCDVKYLRAILGKWGEVIKSFALGEDISIVSKIGEENFIKTIGNSITTPRDLVSYDDVKSVFFMLAESVAARLRKHGFKGSTVQIYVRNTGLFSCERQGKLEKPSCISLEIGNMAMKIFEEHFTFPVSLRSIGIRCADLIIKDSNVQLDLFNENENMEKLENLECKIDDIRSLYGYSAIQKGILLLDKNLTHTNVKDAHVIFPQAYRIK